MRLINTHTRKMEEFIGSQTPPYAILSHTWEMEEVSLKDYSDLAAASKMKGYDKIDQTCRIAQASGISFAWVDTCCIDKTSSAELSEAINSMFAWYKNAEICYAFLSDMSADVPWDKTHVQKCRWWTRGWTLQELVAPRQVVFYDSSWTCRGDRSSHADMVSSVTGISIFVLKDPTCHLPPVPNVCKMSWVTNRKTTREEDIAYCLLGLFGVNMPLLYGEGMKAFRRLQEEILRQSSDDMTLFCWFPDPTDPSAFERRGLFSDSPREFAWAVGAKLYFDKPYDLDPPEMTVTNRGVKTDIQLGLFDFRLSKDEEELSQARARDRRIPPNGVLVLLCPLRTTEKGQDVAAVVPFSAVVPICVRRVRKSVFERAFYDHPLQDSRMPMMVRTGDSLLQRQSRETIYIQEKCKRIAGIPLGLAFRLPDVGINIIRADPPWVWNPSTRTIQEEIGRSYVILRPRDTTALDDVVLYRRSERPDPVSLLSTLTILPRLDERSGLFMNLEGIPPPADSTKQFPSLVLGHVSFDDRGANLDFKSYRVSIRSAADNVAYVLSFENRTPPEPRLIDWKLQAGSHMPFFRGDIRVERVDAQSIPFPQGERIHAEQVEERNELFTRMESLRDSD